jgi:predicted MFS family arabinose efflux permease
MCLSVPFLAILTNTWTIGLFFFFWGINVGSLDVAMNGQAVYVERLWSKPIMSSFHAVFSIGMAIGAGTGALFAKFQVSLFSHFLIASLFCLVAIVWAIFHLLKEEEDSHGDTDAGHFRLPTKAILPLGIIAFCGMTGEGTLADWSALYMNKVVGKDEAFSAIAFGAFASAMTVGRIFGDYFTAQWGKSKLLIINSLLAIVGILIAILLPYAATVLIGFFLCGLGLATVVPIIYSTAGNTKGVAPSVGIAMATTVGYAGFFVGPPVIGYLADMYSLRVGFCFTLFLFLAMLVLVYRKRF